MLDVDKCYGKFKAKKGSYNSELTVKENHAEITMNE